jgi:hypothetical protein
MIILNIIGTLFIRNDSRQNISGFSYMLGYQTHRCGRINQTGGSNDEHYIGILYGNKASITGSGILSLNHTTSGSEKCTAGLTYGRYLT